MFGIDFGFLQSCSKNRTKILITKKNNVHGKHIFFFKKNSTYAYFHGDNGQFYSITVPLVKMKWLQFQSK